MILPNALMNDTLYVVFILFKSTTGWAGWNRTNTFYQFFLVLFNS